MNIQDWFFPTITNCVNFFCFLVTAFVIIKKIGRSRFLSNFLRIFNLQIKNHLDYPVFSYYYWHKQSQFEILPSSESEIIMLGDSITDEGEWTELFRNLNIKNRGISGDTTIGILNRLHTIIASHPKQIFIMIGINDLLGNKNAQKVLDNYQIILQKLKENTPSTQVFIQSILPVNNQVYLYWQDNNNIIKLNSGLQELAQKYNYQYIDLFSHFCDTENQLDVRYTKDGLHLNGQGYLVWKSVIERYVAVSETFMHWRVVFCF
jgi:lysophospholipase L1-like esterase